MSSSPNKIFSYCPCFWDEAGERYLLIDQINDTEQRVLHVGTGVIYSRKSKRHYRPAAGVPDVEHETLHIMRDLQRYHIASRSGKIDLPHDPKNKTKSGFTRVTYGEYFNGGTLRQFMDTCRRQRLALPQSFILTFAAQMVRKLDRVYAHSPPVIHGALRAENVFLRWSRHKDYPDFYLGGWDRAKIAMPADFDWMTLDGDRPGNKYTFGSTPVQWDVPALRTLIDDLRALPGVKPGPYSTMFTERESKETVKALVALMTSLCRLEVRAAKDQYRSPGMARFPSLLHESSVVSIHPAHFCSPTADAFKMGLAPVSASLIPELFLYVSPPDAVAAASRIRGPWRIAEIDGRNYPHRVRAVKKRQYGLGGEELEGDDDDDDDDERWEATPTGSAISGGRQTGDSHDSLQMDTYTVVNSSDLGSSDLDGLDETYIFITEGVRIETASEHA